MAVTIAVLKERLAGETRVAMIPEIAGRWVKGGAEVVVETGAGTHAAYLDDQYTAVGASIAPDATAALADADIVLKVRAPEAAELSLLRPGSTLIGLLEPFNAAAMEALLKWQFTPGILHGAPVPTQISVEVRFSASDVLPPMFAVLGR